MGLLPAGDPTHGANIKKAEYNGLLDGIWASTTIPIPGLAGWDTGANATRGEVAQMLWNLLRPARGVAACGGRKPRPGARPRAARWPESTRHQAADQPPGTTPVKAASRDFSAAPAIELLMNHV